MNLLAILSNIGLPDILDILLISIVAYQFYLWFWGTKAFKALIGILLLSGVFVLAQSWGLFLTTWVFQLLWQVFVILLIILFQKEIRQILERFSPLKSIGLKQDKASHEWIPAFSAWAFEAARRRIGAVVVFERTDLVFDLVTKGISMEGDLQPEILNAIFYTNSPLHDGAILVSNGKIVKTSCYLPLSTREDLPQKWGTRHRAALGLSEQCNAWVLVISEERGEISCAFENQMRRIETEEELIHLLETQVFDEKEPEMGSRRKMLSWFTRRYPIKVTVFALVFVLWLSLAGQQNFERKIDLPLTLKNVPANLAVSSSTAPSISITCRGLRKDVSLLSETNIMTILDLAAAKAGKSSYAVTAANFILPNDRVDIVNITPSRVELIIEKVQKPEIKDHTPPDKSKD